MEEKILRYNYLAAISEGENKDREGKTPFKETTAEICPRQIKK